MILCCGEALIDFVPMVGLSEQGQTQGYRPCPGGSPYNVAVGLGRLHVPVAYFSKISTDFFGEMLVRYLADNGVDTQWVVRAPGATTLAFVSLPSESEPQFAFYAEGATDRSLTERDLPPSLPQEIRALHFGSISLVMQPCATALETLMRRESGQRILTLDPNVRPGLIADPASYRRRFEEWVRMVDVLRLSAVDLAWLYPDMKPEEAANQWLAAGPSLVIVTLGEAGALAFARDGAVVRATAPTVQVVDTVGAGDSFFAAILAYLHEEEILYDRARLRSISQEKLSACLEFACAAAAFNCARAGANPPYREELDFWR